MSVSPNEIDVIRRIIARIKIPPGQITLYKVLYEQPDGLSKKELATVIRDDNEESLRGVLGALGRRVNETQAFSGAKPGIDLLLERHRARGELFYRMRPKTRAAIDGIPELRRAIDLPVAEIRSRFRGQSNWLSCQHPA